MVPKERRANIRDNVQFLCLSDHNTTWYHEKTSLLTSNYISGGSEFYQIFKVSFTDQGYYYCKGYSKEGIKFMAASYLKVNSKFIIANEWDLYLQHSS